MDCDLILSVFTSCSSDLTFLTLKKSHDFIIKGLSKTIKFIQHHFPTRSFDCSAAEVSEVNFKHKSVCLPFIGRNISLPVDDDQTFSVVISKVQNEQGILLFVYWKLV